MSGQLEFRQYIAENNAYQELSERKPYIEATRRAQGIVQRTIVSTHSNRVRYTVPAHIDGYLRYNREDCVRYVQRELERDKCIVNRIPGTFDLDISWYDAHHPPPSKTPNAAFSPLTSSSLIYPHTPRAKLPAPIQKAGIEDPIAILSSTNTPPSRSLTEAIDDVDAVISASRKGSAHLHRKLLEVMASDWD